MTRTVSKLAVTVDGSDIQIGAIEIKDSATNLRANVISDGINNALVVTQNDAPLPTGAATEQKQDALISAFNDATNGGASTVRTNIISNDANLIQEDSAVLATIDNNTFNTYSELQSLNTLVATEATSNNIFTTLGAQADAAVTPGAAGSVQGKLRQISDDVAGLLTDTELRATPVPVSGTVTTGGLTDTQLRATPVPVSISSDIEIGAVEIKNGTDDTRVTVKTDGTNNAMVVTANVMPLPTGASTSALQSTINTTLGSPFQAGGSIGNTAFGVNNAAGASAVNIQDGGNSITVDGTVAVSGSVAVTGPLTDTELRASSVPVENQATTTAGGILSTSTTAYATNLVLKASAGALYSITGHNSQNAARFVQIHDTTSLPANGAVPKVIFAVPSNSSFSWTADGFGQAFSTGITVASSTTGPTLTVSAATMWVNATYK